MTLDEFRALCHAPRWSTGRVARDVCAGRDTTTIARYCAGTEADLPDGFRRWLGRVELVTQADGVVTVRVRATPGREAGGWPKGRERTAA